MGGEIENFLILKFSNGLLGGNSKVALYSESEIKEMEKKLKEKVNSPLPLVERRKLRDKLYDINNVLTEWRLLSSTRKLYSFDGIWSLKKIKTSSTQKIKELMEDVEAAATASNHDDVASLPENVEYYRWSCRSVDTSKVHGLDDGLISLERMLFHREGKKEDRFKGIGIVGTSGIGKTTLAQLIFNKKEVKDYFLPRIWVCMSKQPNDDIDPKVELVKRVLMCLGVEDEIIKFVQEKHQLKGLLYALQLQLKGKRYLIVLDDAWDTDTAGWYEKLGSWLIKDEEWGNKLAYGLPKGNGGSVIVTTRNEDLAEKMVGEENIYRLLPLSAPENCWKIFRDQIPSVNESDLKELEAEFKQKCAGLPLAAKVMGQIMNEEIQAAQTNQLNQVQELPNDCICPTS